MIPLRELLSSWTESSLALGDGDGMLDRVEVEDFFVDEVPGGIAVELSLGFTQEIGFALPGLDGMGMYLGRLGQPTVITVRATLVNEWEIRLVQPQVVLRLGSAIAKPVRRVGDAFVPTVGPDGAALPYEIAIGGADVVYRSSDGIGIEFSAGGVGVALPPMTLGETGIVIEGHDLSLHFGQSPPPPGQSAGWHGVHIGHAAVYLPGGLLGPGGVLNVDHWLIGHGGVSGTVANVWTPAIPASLFGVDLKLHRVAITLVQNVPTQAEVEAEMMLPFFDELVEVRIGIGADGGLHVKLDSTTGDGLYELTKPGLLKMTLDSIGFELDHGVFTAKLSGKLTPLFGSDKGLKWPTFDVKDLSIDSKGHVGLPGGWLSLAQQKSLDFHGFKIEIAQIGFGHTDDGGKWIGFSGALKLVDGFHAGASVDGLRVSWYPDGRDPKVTLNGVGVELLIPDVLYFKGAVSYRELTDGDGNTIHRFDGDIRLLLATPELKIDGQLVIGSVKGPQGRYNFFAIYVDVGIPCGIAVGATGIAIYEIGGLLALQMEPNRKPTEAWFSIDHGKSFYHRNSPGVIDLKNKWDPRKGSFAIGAEVTLATLADVGFTFSGTFLLAIVVPGPVVVLQGAARFLKKRTDGKDEGQFRALVVLDGRAGSLTIGLDAEYKTGKGGEMIEIGGGMEAFFAFHDPTAWHLWLGKNEPREQRIQAVFGRFAKANAYFMLDAHQLALGAWFGYNRSWEFFGRLTVRLEAWAEGNARLSFKPSQFHGDLWIHCLVELNAFGFGLGLALDAKIVADLFTPYHLRGEFSVGIKLPWPFKKKLAATVVLEWGPRKTPPPLPLPVTQVAVEHLKSTVVWPLPRGKYLLPSWDDGGGFLVPPSGATVPSNLAAVPLVPLDARVSVTFGRSVHDEAKVGVNLQTVDPAKEAIGNPGGPAVAKVRYALTGLELRRWDGVSWQLVAQSPKSGSVPALFGSWMPVPQLPDGGAHPPKPGQTKLLLWSKTPFDFTRATGSAWEEWVSDAMPGYPCLAAPAPVETCFGFEALAPGTLVSSPWTHPGPPAFTLSWGFGAAVVQEVAVPAAGAGQTVKVVCFPEAASGHGVKIHCSVPGRTFRIVLAPPAPHAPPAPAGAALKGHIFDDDEPVPTCVDVRTHAAGTVPNPWTEAGVRFSVLDASGQLLHPARVERWGSGPLGLNAGDRLDVELPCASLWVELIVTHRPPFRVVAYDAAGTEVATHAPSGAGGPATETIRLTWPGITRVAVHAAGNEKLVHSVCYACPLPAGPWATGHDIDGTTHGPFAAVDGTIVVSGSEISDVVLMGGACIQRICVTPDPDAGQGVGSDEVIDHVRQELVRWHDEGALLTPHTTYQLTLRTLVTPSDTDLPFPSNTAPVERAYFRTEGPPGLTRLLPPEGVPAESFDSGLDDLVRYVRETDPPTVPPPGDKPILFRPFYRAYDLGVEFNEDYVEQMYRMDRRDLGLYLYDNNNQPVRDAKGRLLALGNRWAKAETLTLSEKDTRWLAMLDAATCLPEKPDPQTIPRASVLASSDTGRVLAPDTLHEARLVPLLLHETFAGASLANPGAPPGWYAEDSGPGGPSQWEVGEVGDPLTRVIEERSSIGDGGPERSGTLLLLADPPTLPAGDPGRPSEWTDYRVSVYVRSAVVGGAVGVVVRHQGQDTGYRFSLDGGERRLVKLGSGTVTPLAHGHFAARKNRDYRLTVEVLGPVVRAYLDGEPVFEISDATYAKGRIGLYACASAGARFTDVVVDDLRATAPAVFGFQFTTSLYANFFHHVHSVEDATWSASLGTDPAVGALVNEAVAPSFASPGEKEARAYEELAALAIGAAARQNAARVEVTRVERQGAPPLFLFRSPEPLEPARVELALSGSGRVRPGGAPPGDLKLTDVALGASRPEDESVTVLLREAAELTGRRIEVRELPGPLAVPTGDPVMWRESFGNSGALERFTIVDGAGGPSLWTLEGGGLVELSGIGGGNEPELPGTHVLAGDAGWGDYRLTVDLRADAGGEVGVLLRYQDESNYYRLSLGAARRYRRLVKCLSGQTMTLWEDEQGYTVGEPFRLALEAVGSRLVGFHGDVQIFEVHDSVHVAGQVGLYASANPGVRCERMEVRRPSLERQAWLTDRFAEKDLNGWTLMSEATTVPLAQSAAWEATGGALRVASLTAEGGAPAYPGAYAAAGDPSWTDVIVQARLRSSGGAVGVAVRGTGSGNYYRFSMSRDQGYRQLVKKVGAAVTVLWHDAVAYEADRTYELTIVAAGASLRGYLDGVPLFAVEDADVPAGGIALYAWNNAQAWFSDVRVWPANRAYDGWLLTESFAAFVPNRWRFSDQAGTPEIGRWTADDGELSLSSEFPLGALSKATHYATAAAPEVAELRLAVRLRFAAKGVAGVVFGWRDPANHFALWLDAQGGTRRLFRVEANVSHVLWQDAVVPDTGREYSVTIDHGNGRLVGYVDGVELFGLDVPAVPGRVGLAARGGAGARFHEVRLAAPEWTCWHGFEEDEPLPAGTRVRVHAGPPGAPSGEAGLVLRSAALPGERRRCRLPGAGATLRMVDADDRAGHARTFLPDGVYAALGLHMVRKADGTALFLIPDGAQLALVRSLRLELTYHRDRPEAGRPMSQAGDRGVERATIEFPS